MRTMQAKKRPATLAGTCIVFNAFSAIRRRQPMSNRRRLQSRLRCNQQYHEQQDDFAQPPFHTVGPLRERIGVNCAMPSYHRLSSRFRAECAALTFMLVQLSLKAKANNFLLLRILDFFKSHHDQISILFHRHDAHDFAFKLGMANAAVAEVQQQPAR